MKNFISLSLILIISMMPSITMAQVDISGLMSEHAVSPGGTVCFDKYEIKSLANFKKQCDIHKEESTIFADQYKLCMAGDICSQIWTSSHAIYWGSVISALAIGFVMGRRGD